jgi:hypothetical protein
LDGNVPADDEVTSLTDAGLSARNGGVAFSTTNWSVVLEAQGPSAAAHEALEKLCRTYWRPVYSFIRREGTAFHRFRQRYQYLLREEISHTVAVASDVEDELRHLISVLRT